MLQKIDMYGEWVKVCTVMKFAWLWTATAAALPSVLDSMNECVTESNIDKIDLYTEPSSIFIDALNFVGNVISFNDASTIYVCVSVNWYLQKKRNSIE